MGFKYTDEEMLQMYREAKDKSKQIKILAQLNAVPAAEIRRFLKEKGVEVPKDGRFKDSADNTPKRKSVKVAAASPKIEKIVIPETIKSILKEKRTEIINKIHMLEEEVKEIDQFIKS